MGVEKQGSKGGNYVGGFLQLFDWNAKSRKKLFSSKSDLQEKPKQTKTSDGNLPMTWLQMDEDETAGGISIKGSSDYSCASSVTDEDLYGIKGPGVVARLMGLDSLPKSNTNDAYSTPAFDSQSLPGSYYQTENLEYCQDPQIMRSTSLQKYQKVMQKPIEKFQTENLPPKSAKTVPITHHRLLSPVKSTNFFPPKDAAHIMEAAARIIEPGPQASKKPKGSFSVPLKVRDLKTAQKPLKLSEGSQKPGESSGVKHLKGHSMCKSSNGGSVDASSVRIFQDSEESSSGVKSKGKSISLALQAKANVQKRVLNLENTSEFTPKMLFTSQSGVQKSTLKKPCKQNSSNVLRQNNQKQNCTVDRGKLPLKSNMKAVSGDFSSAKRQNSSKLVSASKVSSRKLESSSSERVTRKKRSIDGNYQFEKEHAAPNMPKDKNEKAIQSSAAMDTQRRWNQDRSDVISFTFNAPMARPGPGSGRSSEVQENCKIFSGDSPSKTIMLNSDGMAASKFSFLRHSVKGGDTLSSFLEQQLKELAHKVEFSQQKSGAVGSNMLEEHNTKDGNHTDRLGCCPGSNYLLEDQLGSSLYSLTDPMRFITGKKCQGRVEEKDMPRNISEEQKFLSCRLPSPVSVIEHSSFAESCNSSDSTDSNNSTGGGKKCSSVQLQDMLSRYSMNTSFPLEGDADLVDSASSTCPGNVAKSRQTMSWEVEYVKAMVCDIEVMFEHYAIGTTSDIMKPHLFEQLENCNQYLKGCGLVPRMNRRLLFDCVSECLEQRCRQYAAGGCKLWGKGLWVVKRKDKLAEDVYKEISGWSGMGDFMVDELVDYDMSSSQYAKWLDYDIEAFDVGIQIQSRILNSLIDEVIADILVL